MQTVNIKTFLETQLGLEGLKIINGNRIVKIQTNHFDIEKDNNSKTPKIMAINFGDKIEIFYSKLISNNLFSELERLEKQNFIHDPNKIAEVLKKFNQFEEYCHFVTYIFPQNIEIDIKNTKIFIGSENEEIKKFDPSFYEKYPMVYAVIQNENIVSCCVSSRENDSAGEAWVFTHPDFRKQGFGFTAVNLWASELQKNKIPLYTHEVTNIASQKLADKLNLSKVFENVIYE